mmetsp:Transcript_120225/g.351343  ORF Transcript_120225/g.351343 Transcript_120225/m.351343 type:complete len:260 (-) Transcript_120225:559-1338(-)
MISPFTDSMHAPWNSTIFGCRTWRRIRISFAMVTKCSMPATSEACFVVFTATGEPWNQPPTTTPNEPAPKIWPASIFRSLEPTSHCSCWPSETTFSKRILNSSVRSSGLLSNQRSMSTWLKMRPVAVVSGTEDRAAADWSSSSCASWGAGVSWSRRCCSSFRLASWNVSMPSLLVVLRPMRYPGIMPAFPSVLLISRFPTMNISTGTLAPPSVSRVVGSRAGAVLASERLSWKRSSSSAASALSTGSPVTSLPMIMLKR